MLSKKKYSRYEDWDEYFGFENKENKENKEDKIDFTKVVVDNTWYNIINGLISDPRMNLIKREIIKTINLSENYTNIFPFPKLVFNAFLQTPLDIIKVVFIGQDPYFNYEEYKNSDSIRLCPQAHGLSFSVPIDCAIPPSLHNIFKNLLKFKHIKSYPKHGNLTFWALQGCLMLNSSLTVVLNKANCHASYWRWFTDNIIKYLSDNCENLIFVLWGGDAYNKIAFIDSDKHKVIVSSHPSGYSADKPFRCFPSFNSFDHFGEINKYLIKYNKIPILWE